MTGRQARPEPIGEAVIRLAPGEETAWTLEAPGAEPRAGVVDVLDLGALLDEAIRWANRSDLMPRVLLACPADSTVGDLRDAPGGSLMRLVAVMTILRVLAIYDRPVEWTEPGA
ncbi:MAG TPA: hypothetical protein VNL94_06745 [Candidatus Binatia bacterium]|nr:hypothetical protein [Candidatus Binatia bacterium]